MESPPGYAHCVSLRLPPHEERHQQPREAGSAVFAEMDFLRYP